MSGLSCRFAIPADAAALLEIYGQYIHTPITFEYDLPSESIFARRIADIVRFYPYLVCEEQGEELGEEQGRIVGYAYAHSYRERIAYQWCAELSVYVDRNCTGRGLGKRLYVVLMDILRAQHIKTVYGCVTVPNAGSEALHAALGFRTVGVHRQAGYKDGAWHDVAWFEKALAPYDAEPPAPVPIGAVSGELLRSVLASFQA